MFGFPTVIKLQACTLLATHWCQEEDLFGIQVQPAYLAGFY